MKVETWTPFVIVLIGFVGMLLGATDPLEGSLVVLPSCAVVALGAYLGHSRAGRLNCLALAFVAVGVTFLFILSAMGGLGGNTGRSMWWALVLLPYPIGWLLGVAGAVLALVEFWKRRQIAGWF
ncbi:MAG: hypothetical protein U0805_00070 [Pirellulales bacterium]